MHGVDIRGHVGVRSAARSCLRLLSNHASITAFEREISLNPNFSNWRFALALVLAGGPARAAQYVQAHMRPVNAPREHRISVTRTRIWPPRMRSWDEWKKLMEAAEDLRIDLKFTLHRSSSLAFKRPEDQARYFRRTPQSQTPRMMEGQQRRSRPSLTSESAPPRSRVKSERDDPALTA